MVIPSSVFPLSFFPSSRRDLLPQQPSSFAAANFSVISLRVEKSLVGVIGRSSEKALTPSPSPNSGRGEHVLRLKTQMRSSSRHRGHAPPSQTPPDSRPTRTHASRDR